MKTTIAILVLCSAAFGQQKVIHNLSGLPKGDTVFTIPADEHEQSQDCMHFLGDPEGPCVAPVGKRVVVKHEDSGRVNDHCWVRHGEAVEGVVCPDQEDRDDCVYNLSHHCVCGQPEFAPYGRTGCYPTKKRTLAAPTQQSSEHSKPPWVCGACVAYDSIAKERSDLCYLNHQIADRGNPPPGFQRGDCDDRPPKPHRWASEVVIRKGYPKWTERITIGTWQDKNHEEYETDICLEHGETRIRRVQ